ncbi:MAG TPA: hypothetical protein DCR93_39280 [Cytophagales bacterium]|nr:hypothetical protein [Cytophagales bacterium]HAP65273.1 hypothetical protein [Cytophagales bacterium]
MKRTAFLLATLTTLCLSSCVQDVWAPGEIELISETGYILAESPEALHDKVIGELQLQFGVEQEVTLLQTTIKENAEYVLALVDFATEQGEEGNMLFILHRAAPEDRLWTQDTKYTTLACSGSLGCKLDVYEDQEEISFHCTDEPCEVQAKVASL